MTRDDIRKLIGGYATGTLTEAERAILFEAALDDQELFDELAKEQGLKELLDEPGAKQRLIAALGGSKPVVVWWKRPLAWAALATAALAVVALSTILNRPQKPAEIAATKQPPPAATAIAELRSPAPVLDRPAQNRATIREKTVPAPRKKDADSVAESPRLETDQKKVEVEKSQVTAVKEKAAEDKREVAAAPPVPPPPSQPPIQSFSAGQSAQAPLAQQSVDGAIQTQQFRQNKVPVAALAMKRADPTRFAFDYRIEGQSLSIKPAADGFLLVVAGSARIYDSKKVNAGSTATIPIPTGSRELVITFSAAQLENRTDLLDELTTIRDAPSGTVEPSNRSASTITLRLKVP